MRQHPLHPAAGASAVYGSAVPAAIYCRSVAPVPMVSAAVMSAAVAALVAIAALITITA